jgi:hypothetical protein
MSSPRSLRDGIAAPLCSPGSFGVESRGLPLAELSLLAFLRTIAALDRIVERHGFDVIHAHLSCDHWLARFGARDRDVRVARTFHGGGSREILQLGWELARCVILDSLLPS